MPETSQSDRTDLLDQIRVSVRPQSVLPVDSVNGRRNTFESVPWDKDGPSRPTSFLPSGVYSLSGLNDSVSSSLRRSLSGQNLPSRQQLTAGESEQILAENLAVASDKSEDILGSLQEAFPATVEPVILSFAVPLSLYAQLPSSLHPNSYGETPLIPVKSVMFCQGVNEMQSIAMKIKSQGLQTQIDINKRAVLLGIKPYLKQLYKGLALQSPSLQNPFHFPIDEKNGAIGRPRRRVHMNLPQPSPTPPPPPKRTRPLDEAEKRDIAVGGLFGLPRDAEAIEYWMQDIQSEYVKLFCVAKEQKKSEKNLEILRQSAVMVRKLGAGRVVCCKSAKDRTSMSVTWEQHELLTRHFHLSEHEGRLAAALFRTEGARRENVFMNTGKRAYAFNAFQRLALPPELRPPSTVCGTVSS
eukprot:gb/GEZN01008012.1/.p1 GENE.gb/GEZN01008012.1/~~gb/GEZN01008012.1/.p1  ORF type:complete len:427 (+),score=48.41 gb/GEZN01008012.1/:46-1281(+)